MYSGVDAGVPSDSLPNAARAADSLGGRSGRAHIPSQANDAPCRLQGLSFDHFVPAAASWRKVL